jgi:plastocyanin
MNFSIVKVNDESNIEPANVEREWNVNALRATTIRRPVLEEYTGAWCGWCPRGHNWFKCILEKNPDVVGIANHYGHERAPDNMVTPDGMAVIQDLGIGGFPSMSLDRAILPGEQDFTLTTNQGYVSIQNAIDLRKAMPTPAHVRIIERKYNADTREVEATVEATFHSSVDIPAKLNLIITEDKVVGSGTGYDQANYMNNTRTGNEFRTPCNNNSPNNPFFQKGEYMKGYEHDHVLRAMAGGPRGEGDFVPEAGKTYTKTFRYTLDANWKTDKIHLVGIVQGGDPENVVRRDIWNADQVTLLDDFMDAGPGFATSCKESVTLNPYMNFSPDGATFDWKPTTGLSDPKVMRPTANPTQTTTYTLTVTKNGKTFTDSVRVRVLPMVNFLPNSNVINAGQEVTFLNVTTEINAYSYNWDFADAGATSTDIHGKHTFNTPGKYKVKLTATKNGEPCGETIEKEINVWTVSRGDNAVYTDVNVYPNPTQGTLYLRSGINRNLEVRVLNLQGQEMLRTTAPANAQNFEVSLDNLAGGIYLLHITDGTSVRTEKIVKQD